MIFENILLALESLRMNKMRAFLTMLGIIIGIGSVITIMTVGNAVTDTVSSSMQSLGGNNITVYLKQKEDEDDITDKGAVFGNKEKEAVASEDDYFTADMIHALCDRYPDQIRAISASETVGTGTAEVNKNSETYTLTGVSTGYFYANDYDLVAGAYIPLNDMKKGGSSALVADTFAESLFGSADKAVGQSLELDVGTHYINVTICGVYKYEENQMNSMTTGGDVPTSIYIPLPYARSFTGSDGYQTFNIVTKNGVDPETFASQAKSYLTSYYRDNENFQPATFCMESVISQMSRIMNTVTLAITAIAAIALVVGGIGVMNIMLVSITERTREIGTRKALGATNGSIRMQFIIEAVIICLIGGAIGIALGCSLGYAVTVFLKVPGTATWQSIVLSLGFSSAVGVFFGFYPANKAAKMNPIDALRYE